MKLAVEELPPAAVAAVVNPTPHAVTRRGRACRCVPRMNTAPRVDQKKDHRKQSKTDETVATFQTVPTVTTVQNTPAGPSGAALQVALGHQPGAGGPEALATRQLNCGYENPTTCISPPSCDQKKPR